MQSLPLPVRIAAGLAVSAVEQARKLPQQLAGLPVTVVSQALQLSMRVQQHVTELAIKGDEVLATLRPTEDVPEWATFDEDESADTPADTSAGADGVEAADTDEDNDPWSAEERALATEASVHRGDSDQADTRYPRNAPHAVEPPAALANYDELSLSQLRGRLRWLDEAQLSELLAHERAHADRPQFATMLANRIATLRAR